jgi:DME family drug/metabolite transporter
VFIAAVAWGTGGAVAAVLYRTSGLGPIAVSFWRFVVGAALLVAAAPLLRSPAGSSVRELVRTRPGWLVGIGAGLAISQSAYFAAVQRAVVMLALAERRESPPTDVIDVH